MHAAAAAAGLWLDKQLFKTDVGSSSSFRQQKHTKERIKGQHLNFVNIKLKLC